MCAGSRGGWCPPIAPKTAKSPALIGKLPQPGQEFEFAGVLGRLSFGRDGAMKPVRASNAWVLLTFLFGWTNLAAAVSMEGTEEDVLSHQPVLPGGTGPIWRTYVSPSALVATRDGKRLFVACATANQVATYDTTPAK